MQGVQGRPWRGRARRGTRHGTDGERNNGYVELNHACMQIDGGEGGLTNQVINYYLIKFIGE
jgi:hypothetical protein